MSSPARNSALPPTAHVAGGSLQSHQMISGREGGRASCALRTFASPPIVLAAALVAASFTPLPDADELEPSIINEVEHALSRAYCATNAPASRFVAPVSPLSTNNAPFSIQKASLSRSDLAIWLVSRQKSDGRWYDGTNDVTAVAIAILEEMTLGGE